MGGLQLLFSAGAAAGASAGAFLFLRNRREPNQGSAAPGNGNEGHHAAAQEGASPDEGAAEGDKGEAGDLAAEEGQGISEEEELSSLAILKSKFQKSIVSPNNIDLDLDNFPYFISETTKELLLATLQLHLKRHNLVRFAACFPNLSNWVLLCGPTGSEVYQDALVRALAKRLQVKLISVEAETFLLLGDQDKLAGLVSASTSSQPKRSGEDRGTNRRDGSDSSTTGGGEGANDLHLYSSMSKHLIALATLMAVGVAVGAMSKSQGTTAADSGAGGRGSTASSGGGGGGGGGANKVSGDAEESSVGGGNELSYGETVSTGDTRTLRIGDRVTYINTDGYSTDVAVPSRPPRGATGQVVATYETVGVRFDTPVPGGHSLSGLCDTGHGHICYASELQLEEAETESDENPLTTALYEVLDSTVGTTPVIVFIRDSGLLAEAAASAAAFKAQLGRLVGPVVFIGSYTTEPDPLVASKDLDRALLPSEQYQDPLLAAAPDALVDIFPNKVAIHPPFSGPMAELWGRLMERDKLLLQAVNNRKLIQRVMASCDLECNDLDSLSITEPLTEDDVETMLGWAVAHAAVEGRAEEAAAAGAASKRSASEGAAAMHECSQGETPPQENAGAAVVSPLEAAVPGSGPATTFETHRGLEEAGAGGGLNADLDAAEAEEEGDAEDKEDVLVVPSRSLRHGYSLLQRVRDEVSKTKQAPPPKLFPPANKFEERMLSEVVPATEVGVTFDSIGALESVKESLKELVMLPLQRPELFSRGQLTRPCRGILLFGPPGTGKTMLAKAVATEAGANFINISMSAVLHKWLGEAEKSVRAIFSVASKMAPTVVFVDEVDSLLGKRGSYGEHETMRKVKNEFMTCWDGLRTKAHERVLVLGATNRPFDLDDAIIRRFPRRLMVELPDAPNREKILRVILKDEELEAGFDFKELAAITEGYSGSDLKNLCVTAAYQPIREALKEEEKKQKLEMEKRKKDLADSVKSTQAQDTGGRGKNKASPRQLSIASGEPPALGAGLNSTRGTASTPESRQEPASVAASTSASWEGVAGTSKSSNVIRSPTAGPTEAVGNATVQPTVAVGLPTGRTGAVGDTPLLRGNTGAVGESVQLTGTEGFERQERVALGISVAGDGHVVASLVVEEANSAGSQGPVRVFLQAMNEERLQDGHVQSFTDDVKDGSGKVVEAKKGREASGQTAEACNGWSPEKLEGALQVGEVADRSQASSVEVSKAAKENPELTNSAEVQEMRDTSNSWARGPAAIAQGTAEGASSHSVEMSGGLVDRSCTGDLDVEAVSLAFCEEQLQGEQAGMLKEAMSIVGKLVEDAREQEGGARGTSAAGGAEAGASSFALDTSCTLRGDAEASRTAAASNSCANAPGDDATKAPEVAEVSGSGDNENQTTWKNSTKQKEDSSTTQEDSSTSKEGGSATECSPEEPSPSGAEASRGAGPLMVSSLWDLVKQGAPELESSSLAGEWGNGTPKVHLRPLTMADMRRAKDQVSASTAMDSSLMAELRQWNELYGEGGKRKKEALSYFL